MTSASPDIAARAGRRVAFRAAGAVAATLVLLLLVWQAVTASGNPDPIGARPGSTAAALDIGVLVFREGLECILVLAAITASMVGETTSYRRPVAVGAVVAFLATLVTWRIAVTIVDSLTANFPALQVQAATGLLAIVVLVVVMNWFFHKIYWTGWIAAHNKKKRELLDTDEDAPARSQTRILWGLGVLGFSSLYREGFEVVLFLQNYRLKMGGRPILEGVLIGLALTAIVGALTFIAHRKLPYRKMLVLTGVLLGGVLLVMVGEQAQEMQLARWISTTPIHWLTPVIPGWMGLWFSIFPTVETLAAQAIAALLVVGSYTIVRVQLARAARTSRAADAAAAEVTTAARRSRRAQRRARNALRAADSVG
jgi:high-affinity iron transporter